AHPKDQADDPLHAAHAVEEPAVALGGGGDLDDAAVVPVGRAERAALVDFLVDPVEDRPFPAARLALVADALHHVPALAVHFPRHLGVLADRLQSNIAG